MSDLSGRDEHLYGDYLCWQRGGGSAAMGKAGTHSSWSGGMNGLAQRLDAAIERAVASLTAADSEPSAPIAAKDRQPTGGEALDRAPVDPEEVAKVMAVFDWMQRNRIALAVPGLLYVVQLVEGGPWAAYSEAEWQRFERGFLKPAPVADRDKPAKKVKAKDQPASLIREEAA